jgi:hypothetical protein
MIITNKFGLPEPLVEAVKRDNYSKGESDFSVTEILSSPRITRLRKKHFKDMTSDVTDLLWSKMGTAIHLIMEGGTTADHTKEERLYAKVADIVLSGAIDLQKRTENGIEIVDYKFTSAWALKQEKLDWHHQLNIYAWLVYQKTGELVTSLKVCAIIRDWSRREAMNSPEYPQGNAQMVSIPLWDINETEAFIKKRLEIHKEAKVKADWDEELPECSEEERWIRSTKYAVKKEGRKTAIRVFDTHEEASELWEITPKGFIEIRKGEAVRCTGNFCGVAQFCSQFKRESEDGGC